MFQLDQAKALSECGHKVVFAAIDVRSIRKWRHWGLVEREYNGLPVMEFNFPMGPILPKLRTRLSEIGFSLILQRVIAKFGKPDIIHVHFGVTASIIVKACKRERISYVVTEHSSGINQDNLTEVEIAPYCYAYQNAAAVIAVSSALAKHIFRYSGIMATVVPNIIDFSIFSCCAIRHREFRFISAGHLITSKGFDVLLYAFRQVVNRGVTARLMIMGDGPERGHLEEIIKELGLQEQVDLFGSYTRTQFSKELARSDAFVLASRTETFGVVYAEAMACGLPVIATRCGGPEDFVNERNGILVAVDDVTELAEAMFQMRVNRAYDTFEIKSFANNQFSARAVSCRIEKIFMNVISQK